ncbi:MAG: lytic murein transglycosylase [Maritimibacter sp.]|nr:lytic murein transglycosylase [Maritimibacter sp.]
MSLTSSPADAAAFEVWIADTLRPRAAEKLIRAETFGRAMDGVRLLPDVLERQANQKEFNLPIWEYLAIAASDERIRNGRHRLRSHRTLFNRIEQAFGVEPEVVAAIWGLETGYGVVKGEVPVLSALATLAFRGRRAAFFEDELIAALRLVQLGDATPETLTGSWAGAVGHGQFMPSSMLEFGVDFDGDGKIDLSGDDPTDALASIANYLKKHGWRQGQPWGFEVRLPEGFDHARSGLDQPLPSPDWAGMGLSTVTGDPVPDYGPASVLQPAGAGGVALMALRNFHVLTRYNRAVAYALGIGHLADRLGGGRPFVAAWPVGARELGSGDISEAQFLLSRAGFDTMGIDGMIGPNTTRAVRAYQVARGMVADGYVGPLLLDRLREERG